MKLFVGNLSFHTTEAELEELFAPFGTVAKATVINGPEHRAFAGFGFVTLNSAAEAQAAIRGLAGKNFSGRNRTRQRGEAKRRAATSLVLSFSSLNLLNWKAGGLIEGPSELLEEPLVFC